MRSLRSVSGRRLTAEVPQLCRFGNSAPSDRAFDPVHGSRPNLTLVLHSPSAIVVVGSLERGPLVDISILSKE